MDMVSPVHSIYIGERRYTFPHCSTTLRCLNGTAHSHIDLIVMIPFCHFATGFHLSLSHYHVLRGAKL